MPCPIRASLSPGKDIERRGRAKHRKYDADAKAMDATFSAIVVDAFGSPHEDFIKLVEKIEETAMRGLGQPPLFRIMYETFLSLFSSEWQASNAAIIGQWLSMCKRRRLRGISRRALPTPAAAAAQRLHDVDVDDDDHDADASVDMPDDISYASGPTSLAGDDGE